jgi:hypothetical protein
MKTELLCLSLGVLLLTLAPGRGAEDLMFEEVIVTKSADRGPDLLYVVLTEPRADHDKLDDLVLKYAGAALREAAAHKFKGATKEGELYEHDGNIVFLVRAVRGDREGAVSGFSVEQLQQLLAAKPERARMLVQVHSWTGGKLPGKKG